MRTVRFTLGVLAALGLAILLSRRSAPPEPLCQGKTISAWAVDSLVSPVAQDREQASKVLRESGTNALPSLIRVLRTPDPVLAKPARFLGRHLPDKLSRALFRIVNPLEAPRQRAAAAQALRLLGPEAAPALPYLSRALGDEPTVAWYAALCLAQLGPPGTIALGEGLSPVHRPQADFICYALSTQGSAASNSIPALSRLLQHSSPDLTQKAAAALAAMGPTAVPELIRSLTNKDAQARVVTINALAGMGPLGRAAVPKLMELAHRDEASVREAAVHALAQIRPTEPEVVATLADALHDPVRQVRLQAVQGLSRSPRTSASVTPKLLEALSDPSPEVRGQAATLLGSIEQSKDIVIPALLQKLKDENESVRGCARQALERLGVRTEKAG
jgi:HEAT repeat protein